MTHVIYIIQNKINNKIYIGQTKQIFKKRISQHVKISNNINLYRKKGKAHYIHNAINKYGKNNFNYFIIEEHLSYKDCNDAEQFYIEYFRSWDENFGYNLNLGGNGNIVSEKTRIKMVESAIKNRDSGKNSTSLNKDKVLEIKKLLISGTISQKKIAKNFGIRPQTVGLIGKNKIFKDILINTPIVSVTGDIMPPGYLHRKGENNNSAKFTKKQADIIRKDFNAGIKVKELAAKYSCSRQLVYNILHNKSYI